LSVPKAEGEGEMSLMQSCTLVNDIEMALESKATPKEVVQKVA
jgi:hypothetical protein